jgi:hypothetical protein
MRRQSRHHLLRLLRDYVSYHHQDRIHDSSGKDTPETRPVEPKPTANATVISPPRVGACDRIEESANLTALRMEVQTCANARTGLFLRAKTADACS